MNVVVSFCIIYQMSSSSRPDHQVAAVTRMAMVPRVLGWNVIPVDRMNNAHPINVTCDACTGIPRVDAGPELTCLDRVLHVRPARDFRLYLYHR